MKRRLRRRRTAATASAAAGKRDRLHFFYIPISLPERGTQSQQNPFILPIAQHATVSLFLSTSIRLRANRRSFDENSLDLFVVERKINKYLNFELMVLELLLIITAR